MIALLDVLLDLETRANEVGRHLCTYVPKWVYRLYIIWLIGNYGTSDICKVFFGVDIDIYEISIQINDVNEKQIFSFIFRGIKSKEKLLLFWRKAFLLSISHMYLGLRIQGRIVHEASRLIWTQGHLFG